jgi:hypothetical protein
MGLLFREHKHFKTLDDTYCQMAFLDSSTYLYCFQQFMRGSVSVHFPAIDTLTFKLFSDIIDKKLRVIFWFKFAFSPLLTRLNAFMCAY